MVYNTLVVFRWREGVWENRRCPPVKLIGVWEKVDISLVNSI